MTPSLTIPRTDGDVKLLGAGLPATRNRWLRVPREHVREAERWCVRVQRARLSERQSYVVVMLQDFLWAPIRLE
jgi:hypothetical protein